MEVASRQRTNDASTKTIKRLLNSRETHVKPKVSELVQIAVSIGDKIAAAKLAKLEKQLRQAAREDARETLRKMEQSIDFTDNFALTRDLEGLLGCNPSKIDLRTNNPMEQFGFYLKPKYMYDDDDDDDEESLQKTDLEEGEISI